MELEITLKIEAPELVQAMEKLAMAISESTVKTVVEPKTTIETINTEIEPKAKPRKRKSTKAEPIKEEPVDESAEDETAQVDEEISEINEEELRAKLKHNLIEGNKKGIITKTDMQAVLKKHGAKNLSALPIDVLVDTAKKFLGDDYDK